MLTIGTWRWGDKYPGHYVERLRAGVARHLRQPHRFMEFTPEPGDAALIAIEGCFARLRMFDPEWQHRQGIETGERLVCLDLDLIVTRSLDSIFDRPESFMILQGANAANPCPFNGSVMMLCGGYRPDIWSSFTLAAAREMAHHKFPDDQGWLHTKLPDAAGWIAGPSSGIYAFRKPGWPKGSNDLPADACIVCFPGRRDPSQFTHLPWVLEHWR